MTLPLFGATSRYSRAALACTVALSTIAANLLVLSALGVEGEFRGLLLGVSVAQAATNGGVLFAYCSLLQSPLRRVHPRIWLRTRGRLRLVILGAAMLALVLLPWALPERRSVAPDHALAMAASAGLVATVGLTLAVLPVYWVVHRECELRPQPV